MKSDYKEYVCHYNFDGKKWCLNIFAKDWQEAEARVSLLGELKLDGELGGTVTARLPAAKFWVKTWVTIKNIFR